MHVVVTGATGNVGSRLVERLADDPGIARVVGVSRRTPTSLPHDVEWHAADLAEGFPRELLRGADAVIHLAWLFQPTRDPATTWRANVEGTARLLQAVSDANVRTFVQASSVGAYSPGPGHPVDESWPTHGIPTAAYSREKAYVERLLDAYEARHPTTRVVRLRPGFIFRREASVQQRRLFVGPFAPTKLLATVGPPVLPDPGVTLQVVHTDDVAEAYRLALVRDVKGAFNIATDPTLDIGAIGHLLGRPVVRVPRRLTRGAVAAAWRARIVPAAPGLFDLLAQIPVMKTDRARDELGWQPERDAHATFKALWEGFRSAEGGPNPPLAPSTSGRFRSHEIRTGIGARP
ncbi:NAD-dependent epimerase/dehydratase family protein [Nocardioides immobilis]|uniref:NAD-dependent epimerase/dehydratase family protein n=1 Tax=Nocardioides immobilis TaxID=2049295 RepID=A0A417XTR5_9ACTN|nr:NAD-dependent epimerase/dehydratase family protein [Nocardioides immobilis]RHW23858.1 NAD-dependent epimerase/dehydratase family protein [Nocardioides immobilis]